MRIRPDNERAASEIVGAIILITVFVAFGAFLLMMVTSQTSPAKAPAVHAVITNESTVVRLYHAGGDAIPYGNLVVRIDGVVTPFTGDGGDTSWSIGETLTAVAPSAPGTVQVISTDPGSGQVVLAMVSLAENAQFAGPTVTTTVTVTTTTTGPPGPVAANFTGSPLSGPWPLAVQFLDASTGPVTSWAWTFGDGNTSALQYPLFTYRIPGTYTVSLTVSNGSGTSTLTRTNYVTVLSSGPAVLGIVPNSGYNSTTVDIGNLSGTGFVTGATVRLNATGFSDIAATGVTVVSPAQITCSFPLSGARAGLRNVVVTNPDGQYGMLVNGFSVNASLPAPTVSSMTNRTGYRGWPIVESIGGLNFVTGAVPKLNRTGYADIIATDIVVVSSSQITCTFDLLEKNATTYNLVVTNPDGKAGMRASYFTLSSPAPGVASSPAFSPSTGGRGATVTITAPGTRLQPGMAVELTRSTTTITGYNINVVSPTQVIFTIDIPAGATTGAYTARFMNTDGRSGSRSNRFTVTTAAPPAANFTGTPTSGTAPLTVAFTDSSTGLPTSWSWSFGDGGISTAQNPSHQYTSSGTYTVSLTATNAAGSNTLTRTNYIAVGSLTPPVASFTGSPTSGTVPLTVAFTDGSTGSPTSWAWTFGDGGTSTARNPSHQYTSSGSYTVSLTATNAAGSNTMTRMNYITAGSIAPPVASFTGAPTSGAAPLTVSFTDGSTGSPTSWAWTFGDGGTSTAQNPSHQYTTSGTYTVVLTATNAGGSNTMTRTGYITVSPPAPTVTAITPSSAARGTTVTITDLHGTGFQSGATVTFTLSGHTVAGTSVNVVSAARITCVFDIPNQGWARGDWDVTVTNPDLLSGTGTGLFTAT